MACHRCRQGRIAPCDPVAQEDALRFVAQVLGEAAKRRRGLLRVPVIWHLTHLRARTENFKRESTGSKGQKRGACCQFRMKLADRETYWLVSKPLDAGRN